MAALVTRGFLAGAFAPSLGFAAALGAALAAPPRPFAGARLRFDGPSALHRVSTWSKHGKGVVHASQSEALVRVEPKDRYTQRIRLY